MKSIRNFVVFFIAASASTLLSQEVSVALSKTQARVGEAVQFSVTVRGANRIEAPQTIPVDGLRITVAGQSSQVQMQNFQMSSATTVTYLVVPQFEGVFTIPPFDIRIRGRTVATSPIQLTVSGQAQRPSAPSFPQNVPSVPQSRSPALVDESQPLYFGELVLSKKTAFVGEVVPAELRFYFQSGISGQVGERPTLTGEGFTIEKFTQGDRRDQIVNGVEYTVFTFKTAITAVKTGTLSLPVATLDARLQLPGESDFSDDILGQFQGIIPPGMFRQNQDVVLETRPTEIEIRALPTEGKPADFSGAVGRFTLTTTASPKSTGAGEPVTLKTVIAGQGNFNAMTAPTLTASEGWKTYPASEVFEASDTVNFGGKKTFAFTIVAREDRTLTPGVSFSFFDPATEKFTTLQSSPEAIEAKGNVNPQPPTASPTPDATPEVRAQATLRPQAGRWTSIFNHRAFVVGNGIAALLALILLGGLVQKRFNTSPAGQRAQERQQWTRLLAKARTSQDNEFFDAATAYVAARCGGDLLAFPSRVSHLPESLHARLQFLMDKNAEARYSASTVRTLTPEERSDVLSALEEWHHIP